jgi:hypothetical protein
MLLQANPGIASPFEKIEQASQIAIDTYKLGRSSPTHRLASLALTAIAAAATLYNVVANPSIPNIVAAGLTVSASILSIANHVYDASQQDQRDQIMRESVSYRVLKSLKREEEARMAAHQKSE